MIDSKKPKPKAKAEAGSEVSLKKQPRRGLTKSFISQFIRIGFK